jgi:hypothetical protein
MIGVGTPSIVFTAGSASRATIMRQWLGLVERGFGGCRSERRALRSVELGEKGPGANQCALDEALRM